MDRGTTINIESPKTMGGGESTTGRRDMVEMKRTKGGQGKPKRGAENKKKEKGGRGRNRRKGGEGAEAKRKGEW